MTRKQKEKRCGSGQCLTWKPDEKKQCVASEEMRGRMASNVVVDGVGYYLAVQ